MAKPKLVYIFPSNKGHHGLNQKVDGQIKALSDWSTVTLLSLPYSKSHSLLRNGLLFLHFHFRLLIMALTHDVIYYRYNPKLVVAHVVLGGISFFKLIFVEHNSLFSEELRVLGRYLERVCHGVSMRFLTMFNMIHVGVTNEICGYLGSRGVARSSTLLVRNGICSDLLLDTKLDSAVVSQVRNFSERFKKTAVFVGNGYPWHGVDDIVSVFEADPTVGLVIVGPYSIPDNDTVCCVGKQSGATVRALYDIVDFGVATWRIDLLNMAETSSLKLREYMITGLPVLLNFPDNIRDIDEIRDAVFEFRNDGFCGILDYNTSKDDLKKRAKIALSWSVSMAIIKETYEKNEHR